MNSWKSFIAIGCLLMFSGGVYRNIDAQEHLAQQTYLIFEKNCLGCHGLHGTFTEHLIIESASSLIATGTVVPGKPIESTLYTRLLEKDLAKRMPLGQPQLPAAAILTIGNWIQAGAPDWQMPERDTAFITPTEMLETIETHVNSLAPFDRAFARYFTMTHLYNAGETIEALHAYQRALSKLVNSLSWGREVIRPQPIDPEETIFYIDLRDYEWEIGTNRWTLVEQVYPYSIEFEAPTQTALREKLVNLRQEMDCEVPFIHVDWFLATASLPPLYHDILDLPQTDRALETRLEVNVVENIRNAPGKRVWRAGFNNSGVSANNRVVERHRSRYGAYWKSYDFAGNVGTQSVFTHPLSFEHDGGEVIFNLPNGLQAYYLVDAGGNRLDEAPINIVRNPAASDPTVRNGLSCIGCHTEGMKVFEDEVRGVVEQNPNPPFSKDRALRLYVEKAEMDEFLAEDTARYRQALEKTGDVFGGIEPVQRFHEAFQRPLSVSHAAASVGLETVDFFQKVRENTSLKNLGLGVLTGANGSVKRDTWTSNFSEIVAALSFSDSDIVKRVTPRTERIPGASVHIPDPNLRDAIAETLGKNPNAPITYAEMETLTALEAPRSDIKDLTGLQHAIHLEVLKLNSNPIFDLSPLAGLTTLKHLNIDWTEVDDLIPLAALKNLQHLDVWNNDSTIANLSPLANLTSLMHLNISGSDKLMDLSPLTNLTGLTYLRLYNNAITDITPLANLTNLTGLVLNRNPVSNLAPLANLTKLRHLALAHVAITDITPLAKLVALEFLEVLGNTIKDITPLANLRNLKWLALHLNDITDFSPIDGLRKNTEISWHDNPGFPKGGPKIETPWLWVTIPGEPDNRSQARLSTKDLLADASNNRVTEQKIAINGAMEGQAVGSNVWMAGKLDAEDHDNINTMLHERGLNPPEQPTYVVYGSTALYSPRKQNVDIFIGSNDDAKVWLNGELIHRNRGHYEVRDYQTFLPVTLNAGRNVLLVAVYNDNKRWTAYFGFAPGTEYTTSIPSVKYTSSKSKIHVGDTFTLDINAENVHDLAGWQFDIAFDPAVLEAIEVNEGDFLKTKGGTTFFQKGTIDNTTGKIRGLSSAGLSGGGVTGTGTLLSIQFSAKAGGETQLKLQNVQFGASTGSLISAGPHEVTLVVEGQLATGDVNRDGQVSILDMILIAQQLGKKVPLHSAVDVNGDGTISILDLILVAQHLGESTAAVAPSMLAMEDIEGLDPTMVQAWIERAQIENDGSLAFQQGIANLQRLLALLIPEETALLPNYPNPFNPETWIPYQLFEPAEVTLHIYTVNGILVRTLALGHTPAGIYQSRSRAAYWDGRNDVGESVASGVYFYTLTTGDFTATRKMLIRK